MYFQTQTTQKTEHALDPYIEPKIQDYSKAVRIQCHAEHDIFKMLYLMLPNKHNIVTEC